MNIPSIWDFLLLVLCGVFTIWNVLVFLVLKKIKREIEQLKISYNCSLIR